MTRIVHCPGCKVLLVEPTAGVAIYQCGSCFKVLYAKHAIQSHIQIQDEQMPSKLHTDKVTPPAPAPQPLYKPREMGASPVSTSTYSPWASGDSRPLYTPRHADTGASSLLIPDMQKLALDAFPVQQVTRPSSTVWQKDEFEFQKQTYDAVDVDMYSYHKPPPTREYEASDYHSTLEDFDNHSHVTSEGNSYGASRRMDFYRPESSDYAQEDNAETPRFTRPSVEVRPSLGNGSERLANGTSSASSSYTDRQEAANSQRRYPPLEFPYVVCQHCKRFLEVPRSLPPLTKPYQKLRCGACQKVSRFSLSEKQSLEMVPTGMGLASSTTSSSPTSTPAGRHSTPYNYFHESRANKLDVLTSDHLHGSPSRGSAPASFHHAAHSSNVFSEGKGYESAPEFQSSYSVASKESSTSTHHARSESRASSNNGRSLPMAPCLHELFGYESPSEFLKKQHQLSENRKTYKTSSKGIKGLLLSKLHLSHHPSSVLIINGKTIQEDQVRRAEEQAGPIHPGSYWYDYHVGFWGVMGGPCLGIIPPGIEEFNCPMQRNCAGGKTGVVVNGRELHQQDLDILVKRGLPPAPYAAYTINIDGVVIDLATQTQIRCLGKLAPTMEKRGVGFGMYPLSRGL